jgi:hypothetical protein
MQSDSICDFTNTSRKKDDISAKEGIAVCCTGSFFPKWVTSRKISEKDRFIKTLQEKLNESRSRLHAKDFSKVEEALKNIQLEHSEAVSMLKQIKGGFFTRSHENDQLTDARCQLCQVQQEKRFVEEKYAASVGEILESKLRQNLAEALSAKLNALEKARKATDKLKALKERCSKDSINSELITRQRVEINDLKLKMASLRGMINKQSSS